MRDSVFFRLGDLIYRYRWSVLACALTTVVLSLFCLPHVMQPFHATGFIDHSSRSARAAEQLEQHVGYNRINQFIVLYRSKKITVSDPRFMSAIHQSLAELKHFPIKNHVAWPEMNPKQQAKSGHAAFAVVTFDSQVPLTHGLVIKFQRLIKKPPLMRVHLGGEAIFAQRINQQTQKDLYAADAYAAPASIVVLLLVFGTVVAALIPMGLGGGCSIIILALLYGLAHLLSLSIFTINIALLLGLCLSLDYALFMISRFRVELNRDGTNIAHALAATLATAGRAVFFSGFTVFISLSALLIFPINILFSVGVGGLTATLVAMVFALLVLPALLAVVNQRIHWLPLGFSRLCGFQSWHVWKEIAVFVVNRPYRFFFASLIVLLVLASPCCYMKLGLADYRIFPKHSENRLFYNAYAHEFNANELMPIELLVSSTVGPMVGDKALAALYHLTHRLQKNPGVERVDSIVTIDPTLSLTEYQTMFQHRVPSAQLFLEGSGTTLNNDWTVVHVMTRFGANSPQTKAIINQLRNSQHDSRLKVAVTGEPAINLDVFEAIARLSPYAIAWIMVLTYCILLALLQSVILPLKALFMNALSLAASYGVLVYVFQQGHLHQWLNFEPQGMLDMSLIIIVFCAMFGFSMDYEVFLLTRIQEVYRETSNNKLSVVVGIDKSARIITSAALIVICLCASFMVADILMVKEFGLGIAVAVFVDAFIIRAILVPSTMILLRDWNWYCPKWLARRY